MELVTNLLLCASEVGHEDDADRCECDADPASLGLAACQQTANGFNGDVRRE
jgi:hypothetical protein